MISERALSRIASCGVMGLAGGVLAGCAPAEPARSPVPLAEHHLHIRSEAGVEILNLLDSLFVSEPAPGTREPLMAADAVAALDAAGVERALVLSVAYMFGVPGGEIADERTKVRAENDWVAEQVAAYPDRLVAACSVNPLADYALEEVERCGEDPRVGAFKLHLANSDVDLRDPAHVERLREVFHALGRLDLPVIAHMRTREEAYGAEDARIFVRDVLSAAPRLPVQIAHMAGWGGYDDATDAALGTFIDAIDAGQLDRSRVTFDLAAVVFQPSAAGEDTALVRRVTEANQRLAERIRGLGTDRVVFATDWPGWPPIPDERDGIAANLRLIRAELPLAEEELEEVFANVSPLLGTKR